MRVLWQCNRMNHAFSERDAGVVQKSPGTGPHVALHVGTNLNISDEPFVLTLCTNAWMNNRRIPFLNFQLNFLIWSYSTAET